ncbi:MAG: hypothetical protein K9L66_12400, partial [Spirochaetaceae bacterium]|nr:hypothetical protein [Spirochaetaceae bacterium]
MKVLRFSIIGVLFFSFFLTMSSAASYTWTGDTDGNVYTSTNWSPVGFPGDADDITIPDVSPQPQPSLIVTGSSFQVTNCTIQNDASFTIGSYILTVTGTLTTNTSTSSLPISGAAGTLSATNGNLAANISSVDAVTIQFSGSVTIADGANVTLSSGGGTIDIGTADAFDATGGESITLNSGAGGTVTTGAIGNTFPFDSVTISAGSYTQGGTIAATGLIDIDVLAGGFTTGGSITSSGGAVQINSSGAITIDHALNASTTMTLNTSGTITQSQAVSANTLTLDGGGTYSLGSANNAVTNLDVDNAALGGALSFRDDTGFAMTGVDAGGNTVTLQTDGAVTQGGAITNTGTLTLTSNGGGGTAVFTLDTHNNAVTTLDADTA